MRKQVFWILMIIAATSISCIANAAKMDIYQSILKKDKMVVGISFDSKPFGFIDGDGQVKGMEADLAREIVDRLLGSKQKVVFKNVTSQDRMKTAMSEDVDMVISTMTITPQRKKVVNFSAPYFIAGQVICVRKDSKIDSIDDLMNKKIIVILGTTGEKNIKRLAPNALIQGYVHNSDAIAAFKSGSAHAITTDDSLLQGFIISNPDYMLLPKKLSKEPYGIAFRKSPQTKSLKSNIDKIISEIKRDGTIETIKNKWMS